MSIKKLDSTSISKICVNQVVVDLPMCIKELVENALDAGATKIDVVFYDHGSSGVRVTDNGAGINVENFDAFTQKGATSKIGDFDDISKILTYGFRGEALNAISRLSEMKITTKTVNDDNGWELSFDNNFKLSTKKDTNKAEVGTDIFLQNLFRNLPVRYQEFKNNYKHQFTSAVTLLENYALIFTEARITVINSTHDKPWDVILSNNGPNKSMKDNILNVLGKKVLDTLGEVIHQTNYFKMEGYATKSITSGSMKSPYKKDIQYFFVNKRPINLSKKFTHLLGQLYKQHNPNSKYLVILNFTLAPEEYDINISPDKKEIVFKKPNTIYDEFKKFFEVFLEEQKACSKITNIEKFIEADTQKKLTFNRSVSKNSASMKEKQDLIEKENDIYENLKRKSSRHGDEEITNEDSLKKTKLNVVTFASQPQPSVSVTYLNSKEKSASENEDPVSVSFDTAKRRTVYTSSQSSSMDNGSLNNIYQRFKSAQGRGLSGNQSSSNQNDSTSSDQPDMNLSKIQGTAVREDEGDHETATTKQPSYKITEFKLSNFVIPKIELKSQPDSYSTMKTSTFKVDKITLSAVEDEKMDDLIENPQLKDDIEEVYQEEEEEVEEADEKIPSPYNGEEYTPSKNFLQSITTIKISDFTSKEPTKKEDTLSSQNSLKKSSGEHVCSSKESCEKETKDSSSSQGDGSGNVHSDAMIDTMIQNVARTFQKNQFCEYNYNFNLGFIVCILPQSNEVYVIDQHAADEKFNFEKLMKNHKITCQHLICPLTVHLSQTHTLLLKENLDIAEKNGFQAKEYTDFDGNSTMKISTLPMIKNVTFREDDLVDLLNLIEANPYEKEEARIPKIKNVLASKACRSSIMVGDPLKMSEMKKVLSNLSTLKSPWNCPHGRPTLITLGGFKSKVSQISRSRPVRPLNLKNL